MSAITFGSVGDIIAVCQLAKQIADALDSARGADAEYQALVTEIRSLEKALLEVCQLQQKHANFQAAISALGEIPQLLSDCQSTLQKLRDSIRKYDAHLSENSATGKVRQFGTKVRWELSAKTAVAQYRTQVAAHCNAINMMLATASVTLELQFTARLEASETARGITVTEQNEALDHIRQDIHENRELSTSMTIMVRTVLQRFDYFYQLCTGIKTLVQGGLMISLATYKTVLSMKEALDNRIDGSMIQAPFILEDAIGRVSPVHLQFITSWAAFDAVLIDRFEGKPGANKIARREFVLQERATRREIVRSQPWDLAFRPGQSIEMSVMFAQKAQRGHEANVCPYCGFASRELPIKDVTCPNCGLIFRKTTEAEKDNTASARNTSFLRNQGADSVDASLAASKADDTPTSCHDLAEEIKAFRRVWILVTPALPNLHLADQLFDSVFDWRAYFDETEPLGMVSSRPPAHKLEKLIAEIEPLIDSLESHRFFRSERRQRI